MRNLAIAACLLLVFGHALAHTTSTNAHTSQRAAGAAAGPQATGAPRQLNLEAFTKVTSCLPFNILIKTSASRSSNSYVLSTSVGPEVDAALRAAVVNSTLYLGFNRKFETTDPIHLTVSLPADKLQAVENKAMGSIIINPGFKVTGATPVSLTTSSGNILARDLSAPQLNIDVSGTGDVFVRGAIKAATVSASGTSTVTLSGVTQSVSADLQGISKLYVDAASDAVTIKPKAEGLSKVYYNKGQCDTGKKKQSSFMDDFFDMGDFDIGFGAFGSSCTQITDPEDYLAYTALWSCGLRVRGTAVCVPGEEAAQANAAKAADISVASARSDSATGSSTARASATSSGPTPTPSGPTPTTKTAAASSTPVASTSSGPTVVSTAPAAATPAPAAAPATLAPATPTATPNAAAGSAAGTGTTAGNTAQEKGSPLVSTAADIRVAAAGRRRRRLQSVDTWGFGRVVSSSSSSSSGYGRQSQAVAVASLDCDAVESELYIGA